MSKKIIVVVAAAAVLVAVLFALNVIPSALLQNQPSQSAESAPQNSQPVAASPIAAGSSAGSEPSPPDTVTIVEDDTGEQVEEIGCEATCGDWQSGSCTLGMQYLERACTCDGSGELFYESKNEPASC